MKKQILTGILISTLSFLGCENMNQPAAVDLDEQNLNIVDPETGLTEAQMRKAVDKVIAEYRAKTEAYRAKHAKLHRARSGETARIQGDKITVPDDYSTIQAAVNNASPGDKIKVKAGTYFENVFIATDDLELTAEGLVKIDGKVEFSGVTGGVLENFIVIPYTTAPADGGVAVVNSSEVELRDNDIKGFLNIIGGSNTAAGITLLNSTDCLVKGNNSSDHLDFPARPHGIFMEDSHDNEIDENTFNNNYRAGIRTRNTDDNEFSGNTCTGNGNAGIFLSHDSDGNELKDNNCSDNIKLVTSPESGTGIFLNKRCDDNTIGSDNITNNNAGDGIRLSPGSGGGAGPSNDNTVKKNTSLGNGGVDLFDAPANSGNEFKKNDFSTSSGI